MNKSESIKNLATALAKFQEEISNPKNTADNPFYKSKYAPLPDILTMVRPVLSKHGLSVFQSTGGDGEHVSIVTMLLHSSGEWIESEPLILKAEKATAQGAGSAITYGRRYSLSAILGISSEDDDDGNHASSGDGKTNGQGNQSINKQTPPTGQNKGSNKPQIYCSECTLAIVENALNVKAYSEKHWGRILCKDCQKKMPKQAS